MTKPTRDRLWSRDFILSCLITFTIATVFFLLMTTMMVYAVDHLGRGEAGAGFAASAFVIGSTAIRLGSGSLVEQSGRRRSLLASLTLFVAGCVGHLLPLGYPALIVLRLAHGVTFGIATTAAMTIAQSLIPSSRCILRSGRAGVPLWGEPLFRVG